MFGSVPIDFTAACDLTDFVSAIHNAAEFFSATDVEEQASSQLSDGVGLRISVNREIFINAKSIVDFRDNVEKEKNANLKKLKLSNYRKKRKLNYTTAIEIEFRVVGNYKKSDDKVLEKLVDVSRTANLNTKDSATSKIQKPIVDFSIQQLVGIRATKSDLSHFLYK